MSGSQLVGLLNVRVTGDSVTLMPVGKLQRAVNGGGVASCLLCVLMQAALILHRNKKAFVLVVKTFGAFFSMSFSVSSSISSEGHRGVLEVGGTLCSSGAIRYQNPQSLLHPGGSLPVHRPAVQQWTDGQRGKTHADAHSQ